MFTDLLLMSTVSFIINTVPSKIPTTPYFLRDHVHPLCHHHDGYSGGPMSSKMLKQVSLLAAYLARWLMVVTDMQRSRHNYHPHNYNPYL